MAEEKPAFGHYIAKARVQQGLSQKALAERIRREDGKPISAQYLHDIEHNRRQPSSDHLIHQFARSLKLDADYLYYLVGRIPEDIRRLPLDEVEVARGMKVLRNANQHRKRR